MTADLVAEPQSRSGRRLLMAVTALVAAAVVGIGLSPIGARLLANADDAPPVPGTEVSIVDSTFDAASIVVPVGATVTWQFEDEGQPHDVVFDDGQASEIQGTGTWERAFTEPGEYRYQCTLHLFMDGRVVVDEDI